MQPTLLTSKQLSKAKVSPMKDPILVGCRLYLLYSVFVLIEYDG